MLQLGWNQPPNWVEIFWKNVAFMDQPRELVGCSNYHTCSVCFLFPWKSMEVLKTKCIVRFSKLCKHPRAYHWTFDHPLLQPFPLVPSCILPPRQNTWNARIDGKLMMIGGLLSMKFSMIFLPLFCCTFLFFHRRVAQVAPGTHHQWYWIGGWLCRRVGSGLRYHLAADLLGARSKDALRTSGYHEQTVSWGINVCFGVGLVSHLSLLAVWCFLLLSSKFTFTNHWTMDWFARLADTKRLWNCGQLFVR